MPSDSNDPPSELLVMEIRHADLIDELQKAQDAVSVVEDQIVAVKTQIHELHHREQKKAGQMLQRSMYRAMVRDSAALDEVTRQEQQATDDRRYAAALAGQNIPMIPAAVPLMITNGSTDSLTQVEEIAVEDLENLTDQNLDALVDTSNQLTAGSASDGASEGTMEECEICTDLTSPADFTTLSCRHIWCRHCLLVSIELATKNEDAWPAKCCQNNIPVEDLGRFLSSDLSNKYDAKSIEWSTSDRTYCAEPSCSTFIFPDTILENRAVCPCCARVTCAACKLAHHEGSRCQETEADQALQQLAKQQEWKTCPECRRVIEIAHGCNHMTCFCKTQFCYECEVVWKNCACAQWTENRLFARAELIAERQGRVDVNRVARELVDRHDCPEHEWEMTEEGGECDECNQYLPNYLFRCERCHFEVCHRCRRGRIDRR